MGSLERRNQREIRKTKFNKAIIGAIAVTGVLAIALVAPNVLGALGKSGLLPQRRQQVKTVLGRMIKAGYVKLEHKNGKARVQLTKKGKHFARLIQEETGNVKKPKKWDGKWRIVMYDFREPAQTLRARVRELLTSFGFRMLQKSVWVYPYDCEDIIFILKQECKLGGNLLYIIADQIENDKALRIHFSLHLLSEQKK